MIIRSAYLEGEVAPEDKEAFDKYMTETVVENLLRYPGIRGVTVRQPVQFDPDMAPVYLQTDLLFDDIAAMDAALASPVRAEVQALIKSGMKPFKGRVTHSVAEIVNQVAS